MLSWNVIGHYHLAQCCAELLFNILLIYVPTTQWLTATVTYAQLSFGTRTVMDMLVAW